MLIDLKVIADLSQFRDNRNRSYLLCDYCEQEVPIVLAVNQLFVCFDCIQNAKDEYAKKLHAHVVDDPIPHCHPLPYIPPGTIM